MRFLFLFLYIIIKLIITRESEAFNGDGGYNLIDNNIINFEHYKHYQIVRNFYENRRTWYTSNLGTLLFKVPDRTYISSFSEKQRTMIVFISSNWNIFLKGENSILHNQSSFYSECSVKNCMFTKNYSYFERANAVLIKLYEDEIPKVIHRNPKQIWILYSFDSPMKIFEPNLIKTHKLTNYMDIFNWTMTYRTNADVPIPYGRMVTLGAPIMVDLTKPSRALYEIVPYWTYKRHDALIATFISNCKYKRRLNFLYNFNLYIEVDMFGNCSQNREMNEKCSGFANGHCPILTEYLFFLVLETARCQEYFSENLFYYAYSKGAIPVIWGAPLEDCLRLLPPNSFLHVDQYVSKKYLAEHILRISKNERDLLYYHEWRKNYNVTNEHGYFGTKSMQFCRLCEALNYNDNVGKMYDYESLRFFLDPFENCW